MRVSLSLSNERGSECRKAVVSDRELHKADEVSEVDYEEVCDVGEADELDEDCEACQADD